MTNLRSIVEATGVGVILISHLRNPQGNQKSHEEGGRVTANQLRGSGAIKQISDNIIGVERDQQGDNPDISTFRVLKNRLIGTTGWAGEAQYSHETGRLINYVSTAENDGQLNSDFDLLFSMVEAPGRKEENKQEESEDNARLERDTEGTGGTGETEEFPTPY